jgi:hypothetical protein
VWLTPHDATLDATFEMWHRSRVGVDATLDATPDATLDATLDAT